MQAVPTSGSSEVDLPGSTFESMVGTQHLAAVYLAVIPQLMGFVRRNLNQDPQISLRMGQFRLMHVVHQNLADSISDTASALGVTLSSASKMVDDLEGIGLLSRRPDHQDRRRTILSLTDEGRQVYQRAVNSIREQLAIKFGSLTAVERGVLFCAALKLTEIFQPLNDASAANTRNSASEDENFVAEHA